MYVHTVSNMDEVINKMNVRTVLYVGVINNMYGLTVLIWRGASIRCMCILF